jgi:DNA-3-methyladenine glycosylase I
MDEEDAVKEFKKHFKFTGPTIVHEFLTSTGYWPTPHDQECFMFSEVK